MNNPKQLQVRILERIKGLNLERLLHDYKQVSHRGGLSRRVINPKYFLWLDQVQAGNKIENIAALEGLTTRKIVAAIKIAALDRAMHEEVLND